MKHPYINMVAVGLGFFNAKFDWFLPIYAIGVGCLMTYIFSKQPRELGFPMWHTAVFTAALGVGTTAGMVEL